MNTPIDRRRARLVITHRIILVSSFIFMSDGFAQYSYPSQAAKQHDIEVVRQQIRGAEGYANSGNGLSELHGQATAVFKEQLRIIENTPVANDGGMSRGYVTGRRTSPSETSRMMNDLQDFAARDSARAQQEIARARDYYGGERNRIQREFAGAHDDLERKLQAIERSERGGDPSRTRGPSPAEVAQRNAERERYNQLRQEVMKGLMAEGATEDQAISELDRDVSNYMSNQAADNNAALDQALLDPKQFQPGAAMRDYPESADVTVDGVRVSLPKGTTPDAPGTIESYRRPGEDFIDGNDLEKRDREDYFNRAQPRDSTSVSVPGRRLPDYEPDSGFLGSSQPISLYDQVRSGISNRALDSWDSVKAKWNQQFLPDSPLLLPTRSESNNAMSPQVSASSGSSSTDVDVLRLPKMANEFVDQAGKALPAYPSAYGKAAIGKVTEINRSIADNDGNVAGAAKDYVNGKAQGAIAGESDNAAEALNAAKAVNNNNGSLRQGAQDYVKDKAKETLFEKLKSLFR